jgi:hypothetical protein
MAIQLPGWTQRDDALLHTCCLANLMITGGDLSAVPAVTAVFACEVPGERLWAAGLFALSKWGALGDGSWDLPPGEPFKAPGLLGTGLAAAELVPGIGLPAAIARRRLMQWHLRRQAGQDAIPRWVPLADGWLFSSAYGFYLQTSSGVYPWLWKGVTSALLAGPGELHINVRNGSRSARWQLMSDWSELIFVTWALARNPTHPGLVNGWLPPRWIEYARAWGRHVPLPVTAPA